MHPALSVILLTTLIGVGQGLFLALFTGQVYDLATLLDAHPTPAFFSLGSLIALLFLVLGLVASFFHLGHPERAWRSIAQWRTSWLSREVLALPLTLGLIALYGLTHFLGWTQPLFVLGEVRIDATLLIGIAATLFTFGLFVCTGMIYAGLKFLQEWHSPLTVVNFTLLGIASGFTLAAAISAWMNNGLLFFYGGWAVVAISLGLLSRGASLVRNGSIKHKSTPQSAIGIRHTHIQQKAMGFMGGSFNTREFFPGAGLPALGRVRNSFLILTFPLPLILLALSFLEQGPSILPLAAFGVQYLGLLAERWYFFAEARHPQNIYYQSVA